ncbi:GNAT family N-acetyltransferase [Alteromonas sp.]|uniref:GNAT family N-acetyltransferase n=1 Tax=Alteromonas sp. TaxID=232 RepID=UPI000B65358E|nr:GNAT family N-acetyltransferase [Alteromonas sp.]MAI37308.1 hypothetical protein [Alteromonas sp.]OUX88894.1 MAG: hypothetical protein CBB95_06610 [Alteromonas sp. TMED35]|tara:strand:+ start:3864 stop:4943 length:1080 start_codon:yes stop_codon:yes gene_type:complete
MNVHLKKVTYEVIDEQTTKANIFNADSPFLSHEYFSILGEVPSHYGDFFVVYCDGRENGVIYIGHSSEGIGSLLFKQGFVNQTGTRRYDQLWIEYNGLLGQPSNNGAIAEAVLRYAFEKGYVRFSVSMTIEADIWENAATKLGASYSKSQTVGYTKSLEGLATLEDVISTLSKNTRAKIRKSIKLLDASQDDISLSEAKFTDEILDYFSCLRKNHIEKWQNTIEGSGFQNTFFDNNLLRLLIQYPDYIKILKVQCAEKVLGYSIYMLRNECAYFYCSGINSKLTLGKIKPGYILHCKAMSYFAKRGIKVYDFMGGESQYKRSLSDNTVVFKTVEITSPHFKGKIFSLIQKIKCFILPGN